MSEGGMREAKSEVNWAKKPFTSDQKCKMNCTMHSRLHSSAINQHSCGNE